MATFLFLLIIVVLIAVWAMRWKRRQELSDLETRLRKVEDRLEHLAWVARASDHRLQAGSGGVPEAGEKGPAAPVIVQLPQRPSMSQRGAPPVEVPGLADGVREVSAPDLDAVEHERVAGRAVRGLDAATEPAAASPIGKPPTPPRPSPVARWVVRLREQLAGEEWEAVVGASWLNKIGALVLVIGIALFLGYSFVRLGPGGRVLFGFAVSLAMLIGGVVFERRVRYRLFARGLIGGGWAAVYFTTYAMHGVEAARIVHRPALASIMLLTVAAGMIAHSLRYRSEAVTGLAYVIGFVTIAISPVSTFSLFASLPLVATLLIVAQRFAWNRMPLFGVIFAYSAYVARFAVWPTPEFSLAAYVVGQGTLSVYWLLFEGFDILGLRRRSMELDVGRAVFPLNATGFFGVSLLQWSPAVPMTLYAFFGATAGAYVLSALIRARLRGPSTFPVEKWLTRALLGGYEAGITLAAASGVVAIFLGFTGLKTPLALLVEGQALFVAGLSLRERYLRVLAGLVFILAVLVLGIVYVPQTNEIAVLGVEIRTWVPLGLLIVTLFYLNRWLLRATPLLFGEQAYSYVASALLVLVLGFETPVRYVGVAWLLFALALFELAIRRRLVELRLQAYVVAALAIVALALVDVIDATAAAAPIWPPLAIAAALSYGLERRVIRLPVGRLPGAEHILLRYVSSTAGTVWVAAVLWHELPSEYVAPAWLLIALGLFELGARRELEEFRFEAYGLAALALETLVVVNTFAVGTQALRPWLGLGVGASILYAAAGRIFRLPADRLPGPERRYALTIGSAAGTALLATFVWYALPSPVVAVVWGALGLVLIELGFGAPLATLRWQGHVVVILALGRLFIANFTIFSATAGVPHRLLTVLPLIVLCYYLWNRLRGEADGFARWETKLSQFYLYAPAILAAVLLRFELGRVAAVLGWAVLGLVLLVFGVRGNNRDLRYQSYVLAMLTFARVWATNFYIPESLAGALGRLVTGSIVVASFYAAQLLLLRSQAAIAAEGSRLVRLLRQFDANGRTVFSILGTVLFTLLLFYEVSGAWLTVAWGLEGVVLLAAGFVLRERSLRLSGLFLLLVCILKLFVYDLRALDILYRIFSFAVLGLLLLGVSWTYTRFREQLRRYL